MRSIRRRRRLSMTSLIDVIFLLLLFFMLSSTFTRFAEVELSAAAGSAGQGGDRPLFLQLGPDAVRLNGADLPLEGLAAALRAQAPESGDQAVLVSLRDAVTAQRLTDLLVVLRGVDGMRITVLGAA